MNSLIWFKSNLRVADNPSLISACEHERTIAVYCFDPKDFMTNKYGFKRMEKFRAKFLIQTIEELKTALAELNITLLVYHDEPENVVPNLIQEYKIDAIYTQAEWTRDENTILSKIKEKIPSKIDFKESFDQFLYHPQNIPFDPFNDLPNVFTTFRKKVEKLGSIQQCAEKPIKKPFTNLLNKKTKVPTLRMLGFKEFEIDKRSAFPFKGGEMQAFERLQDYFWRSRSLASYKKTRNGLIGLHYSSKFSPWLANGSISPKTIYWSVIKFENEIIKNQDTYWLIFELLWRDFFKYISLKYGDKIFQLGGILERKYIWEKSIKKQEQWISGTTAEPFVNANMKELAATGWMSNRGRQNVASYWSKELRQDWRIGASYFESMLLDYDVHSNWCNWMYLSGVGNDPRDRKFNIKRQASMYDPDYIFQKRWP